MNVLIVGHPHVIQVSERKCRKHIADLKAVMVDGILYWHKVARRGDSEPRAIVTHLDRDKWNDAGYYEWPTRGEFRLRMSHEPGEGGPVTTQLEQGLDHAT